MNGRAEDALDLLLKGYKSVSPTSNPLPSINQNSPEDLLRLTVAISLCGAYTEWGHSYGVLNAINGLCDFLRIESIADTRNIDRDELSHAVWVCLAAVPDRTIRECISRMRRIVRVAGTVGYDLRKVRELDEQRIRKVIHMLCSDPVPAYFITRVLGLVVPTSGAYILPLLSGGAAGLLLRVGLLDWCTPQFITEGFPAVRVEATRTLEEMQRPDLFLVAEFYGGHCDECPICPANPVCVHLCEGLI